MELRDLVHAWFEKWEEGSYREIPVTDDFTHTSPFGTVSGKDRYLRLVAANEDQFLGHRFELHDEVYDRGKACVRYTSRSGDFSLDVSEWFFGDENGIAQIVSYYHLGESPAYPDPGPDE